MIKIGIIGAGKIAHRFMEAINQTTLASVEAIYVRNGQKGQLFAEKFKIGKVYTDLEKMLQDESIQAVYVATPNFMHYENIMQSLAANKHVICEKPMFIDEKECNQAFLVAKQKNLILMEAMKVCLLPTTMYAKQLIEEGRIGKIRSVRASFCRKAEIEASHPIFDVAKGGGALFDVGCYPLAFCNYLFNEPDKVNSMLQKHPEGVDEAVSLQLRYGDIFASIEAGFAYTLPNYALISGEMGNIRIDDFWKSRRVYLNDELVFESGDVSEFVYEIEHFCQCILHSLDESPVISEKFVKMNLKFIRQILEENK